MAHPRSLEIDLTNLGGTTTSPVSGGTASPGAPPDGATLYVTLNREGVVAKVDPAAGEAVAKARTGQAPRSPTISGDGTALFVVNYESDTIAR